MTFQEAINTPPEQLLNELFINKVLVIRNSDNIESYANLMKQLGRAVSYEGAQYNSFHPTGYPEVIRIANLYIHGKCIGVHEEGEKFYLTQWHTHFSYKKNNKVISSLQAHQVHKVKDGTGTQFLDCVAGLNILREALVSKKIDLGINVADLDSLVVNHVYGNSNKFQHTEVVTHPLIINHPITNEQSIYAVSSTAISFDKFNQNESQLILGKIQNFLAEYAPCYTHEYKEGDIVIWDNLTTIHRGPVLKASTDEDDCRILYLMNVDWSCGN